MAELFIIKRNWDNATIRVQVASGDAVRIDVPIDAFEKHLVETVLARLPSLSLTFSKDKINAVVSDAVSRAFVEITQDVKNETIRVA
jgi:hypothetical protein